MRLSIKLIATTVLAVAICMMTLVCYRYATAYFLVRSAEDNLSRAEFEMAYLDLIAIRELLSWDADVHQLIGRSLVGIANRSNNRVVKIAYYDLGAYGFEKSLSINKLDGASWLYLANCYWRLGYLKNDQDILDKSGACYKEAVGIDPNNGKFLWNLASYYLLRKQQVQADEYLATLARVDPASYWYCKDQTFWNDAADAVFRANLEKATQNPMVRGQALSTLADWAEREKNWTLAIKYREEHIEDSGYKASSYSYCNLGFSLFADGQNDKARLQFTKGLERSRNRVEALNRLIPRFRQMELLGEFRSICREYAINHSAVKRHLELLLGKAFYQEQRYQDSKNMFSASLQKQETAEARRYLAELAIAEKDWRTAEINAQRAIVLESNNYYFYYLFARALKEQNNYYPAINAISSSISLNKHPQSWLYEWKAKIHWAAGQYAESLQAWLDASKIQPNNPWYLYNVGQSYRKLGNFKLALGYLKAADKIEPNQKSIISAIDQINTQMQ